MKDLKVVLPEEYIQDKPWIKSEPPETEGKYQGGVLEDWFLIKGYGGSQCLKGDIYDDKRWRDGEELRTSYLVKLDEEAGVAETRNTIYQLGKRRNAKEA